MKERIRQFVLSFPGASPVRVPASAPPVDQPLVNEPLIPPSGPIAARMEFADSYFKNTKQEILRWALHSRENDNFTYDLTEQNLDYLAATVSTVTGVKLETIHSYFLEPKIDLREYLALKAVDLPIDNPTSFGRQLGWYAIARATKPKVIIETGVHHGLGSVLLCSALKRNAEDAMFGKYYGTDIDPSAGALLKAPFDQFGKILYGDSIASLQTVNEPVDLFINDSDHSAEYEAREYCVVESRLSANAVILGDNSHVHDELYKFLARTGRRFLFFKEQPRDHWYPGAGIGISFF